MIIRHAAAITLAGAVLLGPRPASARQPPPEPFMLLEINRTCASKAQDEMLTSEIRLRVGQVMVVRGAVEGATPDFDVRWVPAPDGKCTLEFRSADNTSAMPLSPDANANEIQLAASRIAWLASVSPTRAEATTHAIDAADDVVSRALEVQLDDLEVEKTAPEPPEPPEASDGADAKTEAPEPKKTPAPAEDSPEASVPEPRWRVLSTQLALFPGLSYPLSLPGVRDRVNFAIGLIGGRVDTVDSLQLGFAFNIATVSNEGVQLSLGANIDGKNAGIAAATGINYSDELAGLALADFANINGGGGNGLQLTAGVNYTSQLDGIQASTLVNIASTSLTGFQLGTVNVGGDVAGAQIGGVNVGRDVHGVQIGLVNVSREATFPLGLLNIMWHAPFYMSSYYLSDGSLVAGVEHGRTFRWAYRAGFRQIGPNPLWYAGLGLVWHANLVDPLALETDASFFLAVPGGTSTSRLSHLYELKTSLVWRIFRAFAVYGGADVRLFASGLGTADQYVPGIAAELGGSSIHAWVWPGFHVGIQLGELVGGSASPPS